MITFGIVEDHDEIRDGVKEFLCSQEEFRCVVCVNSVEAMLKSWRREDPMDVVLLDIGLPGISGLDAIRLIKEKTPETDIVMFTVHDDPNRIFDALCNGASGYLLKSSPFQEIKSALKVVHDGGAPMSPQIARKVIQYFRPRRDETPDSGLAPREKEVVIGLVDGLSYKMIADRMGVSMETVRSYIKNIYSKLHVHSKAEVISLSLRGRI